MVIRIGTRKSRLAMAQTELVKKIIEEHFPAVGIEVIPLSTRGDENLERSLASFGGKGVFTKELEDALLRGTIDLAVHSAKDMPMELPAGLCVGAVTGREDERDVLLTMDGRKAALLPKGSIIGTSSLRREMQIKRINPGVLVKNLRGNVQTRLTKLSNGEYDGILLAAAGLKRLGITDLDGYHMEYFSADEFVPAAGQGILAVESREGELKEILDAIHSKETELFFLAEREFLSVLGGGCNAPCGACAARKGNTLLLRAVCQKKEGILAERCVSAELSGEISDFKKQAVLLGRQAARSLQVGKVYLVGAGPGDQGLISEKGLKEVRMAEVVLYDSLSAVSLLNMAPVDAELIYVGKRASHHHLLQEETNKLLVKKALEGKRVVRLKGGDPFVFGRGGEEAAVLSSNGIPFEIIPGISSSYAVAAYAGIPVTHREFASSFHVITGHEGSQKKEEVLDYATLAKVEGTLVFLMGLSKLDHIASSLIRYGKEKSTPAAVISQGTMGRQKTVTAALSLIAERVEESKLIPPAVLVIGNVVSLQKDLSWIEEKKLFGKRILFTGTRSMVNRLEEVFLETGAQTMAFSLIHTSFCDSKELKDTADSFENYTWLVFSSTNGVDYFFEYLFARKLDIRKLSHLKIAVIGEGTSQALQRRGVIADFVPSVYTGNALAKEWIPLLSKQDNILLLRAKEASKELPAALLKAGIRYDDIALYETKTDYRWKDELMRRIPDLDYIIFASASAVSAFDRLSGKSTNWQQKIISIGPVTSRRAKELGYTVLAEATQHTAAGIRDLILKLNQDCTRSEE